MKTTFRGKYLRLISAALAAAAAALLVLGAVGCGGSDQTQAADVKTDTGGKLQVTETVFDFGQVPVGKQVEHAFVLKNTGTGPLNLGQMNVKRLEGC
jgi:hypothetical protein